MWQFLNTGHQPGRRNMEIDESLARALVEGVGVQTVRVYGWNPWALSTGWSQSPDDILAELAGTDGIDVVRRPTGGRAILHANELTYSVVMQANGRGVGDVYREISNGLLAGLRRLGIRAALEAGSPHFPSLYRQGSSAACFVSSARSEIKVGSRKLIGSAQRRYRSGALEVVLQHGSLPLTDEHVRIAEYLRLPDGEREALRGELRRRSTDVATVLGRVVGFEEAAECIRDGFEEGWGIRFHEQHHSEERLV